MSLPKPPVVDPNAKRKPSRLDEFVSTAWIAIREFQESPNSLACHAYPGGKKRCQKKCSPSRLELQRATEVINEKALPYDPYDAVAVSHSLLCATHWGETMFGQTLFLDLILNQPPEDHETPTTGVPTQDLRKILAPKHWRTQLPSELLDFSRNEIRRACNNLDGSGDQKDERYNASMQTLPVTNGTMQVLRTESRLRADRQRWEYSPSSSTPWHGPAHLDYSVVRTALAFDNKNGFRCIAYNSDEKRCEHRLTPDEVAAIRDALGCEFTSHLPIRLLENAITRLLCFEHQNAYWKHVYYRKWALNLAEDEASSRKSSSSTANVQSPRVGTSSMCSEYSLKLDEPTRNSKEAALPNSSGGPVTSVSGNGKDEAESAQTLESGNHVTSCLSGLSIDGKEKPVIQDSQLNPGTPPVHRATPDEAIRGSHTSPPRPAPSSSAGTQAPKAPENGGSGENPSQRVTGSVFSSPSPSLSPGAAFRIRKNASKDSQKQQSQPQKPTLFHSFPGDSTSRFDPNIMLPIINREPYRVDYHSFDDGVCKTLLANEQNFLRDMEEIQKGLGLVPSYVRGLSKTQPQGQKLEGKHFSASNVTDEMKWGVMEERIYEWVRICDLHAAASECQRDELFEAAWNAEVHSTVLHLALRRKRREETGVWYRDITTATILSSCDHCPLFSVLRAEAKKVDYAIILEPSQELRTRIRDKAEQSVAKTINHIFGEQMRYQPIAISIETKRPDQDKVKADAQLLVWVSGHFTRLRQFLQSSGMESREIPALPLLLVQGHDWKLYMAKADANLFERRLDFFQEMTIGSTASILGIYTLIASLRRLAEWAQKDYLPWFVDSILR